MIPELDRITDRTYALGIKIELCTSVEQERWLHLRQQLWPNCPLEDHLSEMSSFGAHFRCLRSLRASGRLYRGADTVGLR